MEPTRTRARVIGGALAVIIIGAVVGIVIYQMRGPDRAKVVVVEPAAGVPGQPSGAANSGPLAGVIVNADGTSVANAEVLLATAENIIDVYNTARRAGPMARSDKDGRFVFPEAPPWSDLVVRCTPGFAHVRSGEMPANGRIVIQAWGRVEGVLRVGNKSQADQPIILYGQRMPRAIPTTNPNDPIRYLGGDRLQRSQTVRTDENGRFVFGRVIPGAVSLARQVPRIYQGGGRTNSLFTVANIDVLSGQTIQVDVGGKGRPVIGRVALDHGDEQLSLFGTIDLVDAQPRVGVSVPPNWAALSEKERAKIVDEMLRSRRAPLSTPVSIAADGSFRAEDIPPGRHVLNVSSQSYEPNGGGPIETLAEGSMTFTMPSIPDGRSDEPLVAGTVTVHVRPRIKIGSAAPALEVAKADKSTVKLSDYRGKYVLLSIIFDYETMKQPDLRLLEGSVRTFRDRAGVDDRLAMLAVMLPQRQSAAQYSVPTIAGWTVTVAQDWQQKLDASYTSSPGTYLIDPGGKVLAKISPYGNFGYAVLDGALGPMREHAPRVAVVVEKLLAASATPAFAFKTVPTISKDDAGQNAVFSFVDGSKANFCGELRILNDGIGPRHDRDELLMLTFDPGTVEGRIKADLGKPIDVDQINSYAWYKDSHRWAQVYRVYGSDGSGLTFNPEPKIGTNPTTCGWSFIAAVDTRDTPGGTDLRDDVRGQTGVSIRGETGAIGKYRYLLFETFATETHNLYGQTFWSEIDVVGR